ncbi:unnamed protein product [Arabis nemorensis]|uniref:Uncharacterized protein n=1 Tax=Arabis nemorensis TaxID=586526 RepID=A0A565BJ98_9BRAS|nr:unnamed protein product [Arabis nemorensis]
MFRAQFAPNADSGFRPPQGVNQQHPAPAPQQEINKKVLKLKQHVDGGYTDLQTKFETLNSQFKSLDNHIAQVTSYSQRTPCILPRKCEANSKETYNVNFSEDESYEDSMERSLQEEDSDDEMDTDETFSTKKMRGVTPKTLY